MKKNILSLFFGVFWIYSFAQKVGIGSVQFTPQSILDVKGNATIGSSYAGTNSAPSNGLLVQGNVGIGTFTVSRPLHVYSTIDWAGIMIQGGTSTTGAQLELRTNSGYQYNIGVFGNGNATNPEDMFFYNGNTASYPLLLRSAGYWGIATTLPTATLEINGGNVNYVARFKREMVAAGCPTGLSSSMECITRSSQWTCGTRFGTGITFSIIDANNSNFTNLCGVYGETNSTDASNGYLTFYTKSGGTLNCKMFFDHAGTLGINFDPSTSYTAQSISVNGDVTTSGGVTTCSDKRLKKNIIELHDVLPEIMKLKPVTYKWNKNVNPMFALDDRIHAGFIAQDVLNVFPELITENGFAGFNMMNYTSIIPLLTEAIKEQQDQIFDLMTEQEILKKEFYKLISTSKSPEKAY